MFNIYESKLTPKIARKITQYAKVFNRPIPVEIENKIDQDLIQFNASETIIAHIQNIVDHSYRGIVVDNKSTLLIPFIEYLKSTNMRVAIVSDSNIHRTIKKHCENNSNITVFRKKFDNSNEYDLIIDLKWFYHGFINRDPIVLNPKYLLWHNVSGFVEITDLLNMHSIIYPNNVNSLSDLLNMPSEQIKPILPLFSIHVV